MSTTERKKLEKLAAIRKSKKTDLSLLKTLSNLIKVVPKSISPRHLLSKSVIERVQFVERSGDLIKIGLNTGEVLHSFPSRQHYRNYYYCFRDMLPKYASPENYQPLCDIQYRYFRAQDSLQSLIEAGFLSTTNLNIIECGAYVGWKALGYSKYIGETGKIIAIEISPLQSAVCDKNLKDNLSPSQYDSINVGIWSEIGTQNYRYEHLASHSIRTPDEHQFHSQESVTKTDTLANIINKMAVEQIDFINIQTGGAEYEALLGLGDEIERVKLICVGAHYHLSGQKISTKCISFFFEKGWGVYYLNDKNCYVKIERGTEEEKSYIGAIYALSPSR